MNRIDQYPADGDEYSPPERHSDTTVWHNWNGSLDGLNDSKDNWDTDNESNISLQNGIDDLDSRKQQGARVAANVPALIWPTWRLKKNAEKWLMMVNAMEIRRMMRNKKNPHRRRQYDFTRLFMLLDQEFH